MDRLSELIQRKMTTGQKTLSVFITAGYPDPDATPEIVSQLEAAGADFIELGIPFSDPIADGPTIQEASQQALENGMTLSGVLRQVEEIRRRSETPIVLMGYLNPLLRFGLRRLLEAAASAGVDGFIIPDLLPEETERVAPVFKSAAIGLNYLVSPNTARDRIGYVANRTRDFLYCVSVTGVTGERRDVSTETLAFLRRTRTLANGTPCFAGFGISSGKVAAEIANCCDGVIVGSAVIKHLNGNAPLRSKLKKAGGLVREIKTALKGVTDGH